MLRVICSNIWITTVCKCDQWVNNGITMENITLIKCFTGAIVKSVIFETSDENNQFCIYDFTSLPSDYVHYLGIRAAIPPGIYKYASLCASLTQSADILKPLSARQRNAI